MPRKLRRKNPMTKILSHVSKVREELDAILIELENLPNDNQTRNTWRVNQAIQLLERVK